MKLPTILLAAVAPLGLALPAHAAYEEIRYSGAIAGPIPGATVPAGFAAGTPITFDVVFNTDNLVDRTQSVNAGTGQHFSSVMAASLSDPVDPMASLTISVGGQTFTKFDQQNYGTPEGDCGPGCDLGAGDFPVVTFLDGQFAGVGNIFINANGYAIDSDPIAAKLGAFGGFGFMLSQAAPDGSDNTPPLDPFAAPFAVGSYDTAHATFSFVAVPEPATWSLMLLGFGALGAGLRARRREIFAA